MRWFVLLALVSFLALLLAMDSESWIRRSTGSSSESRRRTTTSLGRRRTSWLGRTVLVVCPSIFCQNNGSRICRGSYAYCRCRTGYFGSRCQNVTSYCYGKYGCFNNTPPFNGRGTVPLPESPAKIGVTFYLATRSDRAGTTVINDHDRGRLHSSKYDGSKRTIIITHGWQEDSNNGWVVEMRNALLNKEDANIIVVAWNSKKWYKKSVANTRVVGAMVAELIKFLNKEKSNTPASFYLIGFSLGAHVSGYAGRRLQRIKLARITGLGPAGPYYRDRHVDVRLDPSDADFVDVIHTDAGHVLLLKFGTTTKSGHLDFWPNGGKKQRACTLKPKLGCDHQLASAYFVKTITSQCQFSSYRCKSWDRFTRGNCMRCGGNICPEMGYNAYKYKSLSNGNFYLYTNWKSPFCVYHYAYITFTTGKRLPGQNPKIRLYGTKGDTGEIILEKRRMKALASERFIAPIAADIGTLSSIGVWNGNLFIIGWQLEKVAVQIVHHRQIYTACYKGPSVYNIPIKKPLKQGDRNC